MIDRFLDRFLSVALGLEASRKGPIHRYYVRRGADSGTWGLFIHHIMRPDPMGRFHNHPWDGIAIIFGHYVEEKIDRAPRNVWLVNRIGARDSHRVELPAGPVWTVFLHFRRKNGGEWWFHDRQGTREATSPWRGPDA